MSNYSHKLTPLVVLALIAAAFVLGIVLGAPHTASHAQNAPRQAFDNQVYEVTAAGAGLRVRDSASDSANTIKQLYWGDRVLWAGTETNAEGARWLQVAIRDGRTGWIKDTPGWTTPASAVYTTPGIGPGALVSVTTQGDGAHCREQPSADTLEIRALKSGDSLSVIGGPYQSEYWVWWQYDLGGGVSCWVIDIPGWITVTSAGSF